MSSETLRKWLIGVALACAGGLWWARLGATPFNATMMFGAAAFAVWVATLPRIGNRRLARAAAFLAVAALLAFPVYRLWEHDTTREEIKAELEGLAKAASWEQLRTRLPFVEANPVFIDIGLYYRGALLVASVPTTDAERYLSRVPPESDMYANTQYQRLRNWVATGSNERAATTLADSLERAGFRHPVYYRLRLVNAGLSCQEIASLYLDMTKEYAGQFDFAQMKNAARSVVNQPVHWDLTVNLELPALMSFFAIRQMGAARKEPCLTTCWNEAVARFDKVSAAFTTNNVDLGARGLLLDMDQIRRDVAASPAQSPVICASPKT